MQEFPLAHRLRDTVGTEGAKRLSLDGEIRSVVGGDEALHGVRYGGVAAVGHGYDGGVS